MPTGVQHVILLHQFRRLLVAAEERGIDVVPLKGAHLITSVYPDGGEGRFLGDVDYLVRPTDWNRTLELVAELGFVPRDPTGFERSLHQAGSHLDVGSGSKILFEAHRYIFEPSRVPIDHEGLWRRSRASDLEGVPCRRLSDEDHFVYTALHCGLHRLMSFETALKDLQMLLCHGSVDLEVVVRRAREWSATRVTWLCIESLREKVPDIDLEPTLAALAPPRTTRVVLRSFVDEVGRSRVARLHHRVQAGIVWPWIMDRPSRVIRLVANHPELVRRVRNTANIFKLQSKTPKMP